MGLASPVRAGQGCACGSFFSGMGVVSWQGLEDLAALFLSAGSGGAAIRAYRVRQSLPGLSPVFNQTWEG